MIARKWISEKRYQELISCAHGGWYQDDVLFEPLAIHFIKNHLFVVEPNPISPNESTSYSNLYHCDRDGVYLYIDTVSGQLADAIGKSEGRI